MANNNLLYAKPLSIKGQYILTPTGRKLEFCPKSLSAEAVTKTFEQEHGCGRDEAALHQGHTVTSSYAGVSLEANAYLTGNEVIDIVRDGVAGKSYRDSSGTILPSGFTVVGTSITQDGGLMEVRYLECSVKKVPSLSQNYDDYGMQEFELFAKKREINLFEQEVNVNLSPLSGDSHAVLILDAAAMGVDVFDGLPVSEWNDLVSFASQAAQTNVAAQPTYDDEPFVEFDGTDDYIVFEAITQTLPLTIFLVAKIRPTGSAQTVLVSGADYLRIGTDADDKLYLKADVAGEIKTPSAIADELALYTISVASASSSIRINGVTASAGSAGTDGLSSLYIGALSTPLEFAEMDLHYLEIAGGLLTTAKRNERETALLTRFGLS